MTIFVLDQDLRPIEAVTDFNSLVWTERYNDHGEFELICVYRYHLYTLFQLGNVISISDSDRLMIIEDRAIETNDGLPIITITGRSFEKVLMDRIVFKWPWDGGQHVANGVVENISWRFNGNFQTQFSMMFNLCFGKYTTYVDPIGTRYFCGPPLPYVEFRLSSDSAVTSVTEYDEGITDTLYSIAMPVIQEKELGFRMVYSPNDNYKQSKVYAELYKGVDRSENQTDRIPVIFSEAYQNLKASRYYETNRDETSSELFAYEDQVQSIENGDLPWGTSPGMSAGFEEIGRNGPLRSRIVFIVVTNYYDTERYPDLTDSQRYSLVNAEHARIWNSYKREEIFEAELLPNGYFVFGKDYYLGDIVSINTEFGVRASARVTEVVRSYDAEGEHILPSFQVQTFTAIPTPDVET